MDVVFDEESITNVPYRELIGSLNYLAVISRLTFHLLHSFLTNHHWLHGKHQYIYITFTFFKAIHSELHEEYQIFKTQLSNSLKGKMKNVLRFNSNADWWNYISNRKSITGITIYTSVNLVSWTSKKQVVALSTAEAEYLAAAHCATNFL